MRFIEFILVVIFCLPFYALLIYSVRYPEQAAKMGRRWMYKGDIEPSEGNIKYTRVSGIIGIIFITLMLIVVWFKY